MPKGSIIKIVYCIMSDNSTSKAPDGFHNQIMSHLDQICNAQQKHQNKTDQILKSTLDIQTAFESLSLKAGNPPEQSNEVQENLDALTERARELEGYNKTKSTQITQLGTKINHLEKEEKKHQTTATKTQENLNKLHKNVGTLEEGNKNKLLEITRLKEAITQLESERKELEDGTTQKELDTEIMTLKAATENKQKEIDILKKDGDILNSENKASQKKIENENTELKKENTKLKKALQHLSGCEDYTKLTSCSAIGGAAEHADVVRLKEALQGWGTITRCGKTAHQGDIRIELPLPTELGLGENIQILVESKTNVINQGDGHKKARVPTKTGCKKLLNDTVNTGVNASIMIFNSSQIVGTGTTQIVKTHDITVDETHNNIIYCPRGTDGRLLKAVYTAALASVKELHERQLNKTNGKTNAIISSVDSHSDTIKSVLSSLQGLSEILQSAIMKLVKEHQNNGFSVKDIKEKGTKKKQKKRKSCQKQLKIEEWCGGDKA
jgi:hypothetical protein